MTDAAFQWSISVGDVVSTVGILVGVLLAWWQLRKANQQGRAELMVSLMADRARGEDALELLYRIDYQRFRFDEETFPGSKEERGLDSLLHSFSQVACLYKMGTLSRRDLALVEYDFLRVYCDPEVQKYLDFLDRTPHGLPTDEGDFRSFREVAKELVEEPRQRRSLTQHLLNRGEPGTPLSPGSTRGGH